MSNQTGRPKTPVIKYILLGLAGVIAAILVAATTQPDSYVVTRAATIAAPPAAVFPLVNDLKKWETWSPWAALDPSMKLTYEGPASGTGASYSWAGNSQVGSGKLTILESRPTEEVRMKLEFFEPMAAVCDTAFTFKPEGAGTAATWTMSGRNNYMSKVMCLFMNMDKMIGADFEKGFANMKSIAEGKR
jgi:hypothetical protein